MRVFHDFFWYPDPDQRFLIRIRIRPNDMDPTGSGSKSGSETLYKRNGVERGVHLKENKYVYLAHKVDNLRDKYLHIDIIYRCDICHMPCWNIFSSTVVLGKPEKLSLGKLYN